MPNVDTFSEWVLENLYLAGAVTAAVLVVVLLVLLVAARRRRRSSTGRQSDFFEESSTLHAMDLTTPLHPDIDEIHASLDVGDDDARATPRIVSRPGAADDEPDLPTTSLSSTGPARASGAGTAAPTQPGRDHAFEMVSALVNGSGDLSEQDLRRLGLLRPEQIIAAAERLEPSLAGKTNEHRRSRLTTVRRHADSLMAAEETRAVAREQEAAAPAEPSAGSPGSAPAPAAEKIPTGGQTPPAEQPSGAEARDPGLPATPATEYVAVPTVGNFQRRGTLFPRSAPVIIDSIAEKEPGALTGDAALSDAALSDAALSDPEVVGRGGAAVTESALDAVIQEPLTFKPVEGAESTAEMPESPLVSDLGRSSAVQTENWTGWESVDDAESWEIEGEGGTDESWVTEPAPSERERSAEDGPDFPSVVVESDAETLRARHNARPRTAEMVLGLNPEDRVEALESMGTSELGRLFVRTQDKGLKLAIIDAVDTTPSPETISMMQRFLDDPDPEVQLKALERAERLLGRL